MITERKYGSDNECKGIQESAIIPILLSSISSTELCLMLLIERDKKEQKIFYRSRNCQLSVGNGKYCISCQELFDSLNHFHHLHLKKPCERFHQENSAEVLEQKTVKDLYNVSLTTSDDTLIICKEIKAEEEKLVEEELICNICEECGEIFDDKTALEKHIFKHGELVLEDVKSTIQKTKVVEEHIEVNDKASSLISIMPDVNDEERMGKRGKELGRNKKYPCEHCNVVIKKRNMNNHMQKFHPVEWRTVVEQRNSVKKNYSCNYCEGTFSQKNSVNVHMRKYHVDQYREWKGQQRKPYPCKYCEKSFRKESSIHSHVNTKHPEQKRQWKADKEYRREKKRREKRNCNRIQCPFCPEELKKMSINNHLLTFHFQEKENPKYQEMMEYCKRVCYYCGREFHTKPSYIEHLHREHKERMAKDHLCKTCGESYTTKSYLDTHISQIHGSNPMYCVECDKTYLTKLRFTAHLKNIHTKLDCTECGKQFSAPKLVRHMKTAHVKEKEFGCNECPLKFTFQFQLMKHIKTVHLNMRPYGCEKCSYKASTSSNLNLHREKMHQATDKMNKEKLLEMIQSGNHPFCGIEFLQMLNNSKHIQQ